MKPFDRSYWLMQGVSLLVILGSAAALWMSLHQLTHFHEYKTWQTVSSSLVAPLLAYNIFRLAHGMGRLHTQEKSRFDSREQYRQWFKESKPEIEANIARLEKESPDKAAILREHLNEAEERLK